MKGKSWLVGLGLTALLDSIALPERGRKRREMIEEKKMDKQPPPAPTARAIGHCPTIIQIVVRPGTESLPRTIAPLDHPRKEKGGKKTCKRY